MFERITFDPDLYHGKPVIRGTRIPVYCILELLGQGRSFEAIIEDHYPGLSLEDVLECVRFATALLKDEAVSLPFSR